MKKLYLSMIPLLVLASGCNNNKKGSSIDDDTKDDYDVNLTIAAPAGAPSVSLYKYIKDEEHVEIKKPAEANDIVAYMASGKKDVCILPTNAGVQAIKNKNAQYKIAATITFGNLFIGATGHDDDNVMNGDDYVVLIQQGNVPDKLFQYVYGDLGLSNVHYLTQAENAPATLISGKNAEDNNAEVDYVLIPEPGFSVAKGKKPTIVQYASLQEEYKKKAGDKEIAQASIFVKNSADKEEVNKFLAALEKDINSFVADPSVIDKYVEGFDDVNFAAKFAVPNKEILKNVTTNGNRMGLGFKKGKDNKNSIDQFLALWPAIGETSEEIYY